ncbi:phosphotransferase RcsD [Affinibrenneria salicis]|uniref:Phosphotransferase RcsD n=1 Tax=Affinibrenneria salicis TaxID=2590031 RepID=A0A5J5G090_9GAMM|nr:phosphotransferase RcsD [Affinibrenneria salicis]KAA9000010.1 phosphotransferase RcsD [Affinibrenneria salicis]
MSAMMTRYFVLLIILLLGVPCLSGYNYVNSWLTEKRYALSDIAQSMQKRIDTYRFYTWQMYENFTPEAPDELNAMREVRLHPDVFYVDKSNAKNGALIFGQHEPATLSTAWRMANYLDILWGAENDIYSMYYLNGQDNSLTLISTQPLKDVASHYKSNYISAIVEARKAEMLQQANMLDERESFSSIRKLRFYNDYYFTIRTTFNQPGHLATIIAFDISINDIIPKNMPRSLFILRQDMAGNGAESDNSYGTDIRLNGSFVEVSSALPNAPVRLVYQIPLHQMLMDLLYNNMWLLLLNAVVLIFCCLGFYWLRRADRLPRVDIPHQQDDPRLLYDEIINRVPSGLLVYDNASNKVILSNPLADLLLPHLNLTKISAMADEHQGVIQATINNEMYEISLFHSQSNPEHCLFLLRDRDEEMLMEKKRVLAEQEYEKSQRVIQHLLGNVSREFARPARALQQLTQALRQNGDGDGDGASQRKLVARLSDNATQMVDLLDNIILMERINAPDWQPATAPFSPLTLCDEQVRQVLPLLRQKGLILFHHYKLDVNQRYLGDGDIVRRLLSLLLNYAITSTDYGKITLSVSNSADNPAQLMIHISDTGAGMSSAERDNQRYPFLHQPSADRFHQNSGLALALCRQLCQKLNGQLQIDSKVGLGTHYHATMVLKPEATEQDADEERLLDEVTILLDITSDAIRQIVSRWLESWGACCLVADERQNAQEIDLLVTDDADKLTDYGLLLTHYDTEVVALDGRCLRTSYNVSQLLQDAVLRLLEMRLAGEDEIPADGDEPDASSWARQLADSDYYPLFVETVPDDLKRLYTEFENDDFLSLAQTAHRLKGAFAMLNLQPGKQLCEQLEQYISAHDSVQIKNNLSHISFFVSALLQQGSQQHE